MNCRKCGVQLSGDSDLCENCIQLEGKRKRKNKSFWGEVEKNQTTIEEFGYTVKTEIRMSEDTVIYIASNESQETVAIKKISLPYDNLTGTQSRQNMRDDIAQRIHNEMNTLSKISLESGNRFVITYYDYKLVENTEDLKYDLYIRMDYLTSVGQLYKDSAITVRDLLRMGFEICDALDWCHKNGRVHNNLNLNNIFVNKEGRFVLGDFASFYNKENDDIVCSAPELYFGETPSPSTDIYSLGMVMYMLLNDGLPPFAENDSQDEVQIALRRLKAGEKTTFTKSVNQRLSDVVCKAIAPKNERYNSVEEIKKALEFLMVSMPDEWLDQNVNEINDAAVIEPENTNKVKENKPDPHAANKVEFREKTEKKADEPVVSIHVPMSGGDKPASTPKKEKNKNLAPEEVNLKKKNIKDFWVIGVVVVVLIALIAGGTLFLYNSGNREIYSLIESGSYAVAFSEIRELYDKDKNVDDLLKAYIDACLSDDQYKRVVQAFELFSDDAFSDTEYFIGVIDSMASSQKSHYAYDVLEILLDRANTEAILTNYGY